MTSKSHGAAFEEKTLLFLQWLFDHLDFSVLEARRQKSGEQKGFDIRISFLDDGKCVRKFYFECKDYRTDISWNEIHQKIFELHASHQQPDAYMAISPRVDFSNKDDNIIRKLSHTIQSPIGYWTPSSQVEQYFALDDAFYQFVYRKSSGISDAQKIVIRQNLRDLIVDTLRRKDEMPPPSKNIGFPKELTLKLPRIDEDDMVGRAGELLVLHNLLQEQKKVVVVNGIGGLGKTTLVQAYVKKYYNHYQHIAWITQLTNDIGNDIVHTDGLITNLSISTAGKSTTELLHEILIQLKGIPNSPNLLILDNADTSLTSVRNMLPDQPRWHLLATSRQQIEGYYRKNLDFLSETEAIALFKKHCKLLTDDNQLRALVKNVDYHTLTIEILAKTAQKRRVSFETLSTAIKNNIPTPVHITHKGDKIDHILSYLTSIFNMSGLDDQAGWLMKQFACLPAEFITWDTLTALIGGSEKDNEVLATTLDSLTEQGWLMYNADLDAWKMHRIIKEITIIKWTIVEIDVERLIQYVTHSLMLNDDTENPVDKQKWLPFGQSILSVLNNIQSLDIGLLQNMMGLRCLDFGQYSYAVTLFQNAVQIDTQIFGPDHIETIVKLSNLAMAVKGIGRLEDAKNIMKKVIEVNKQHFPITIHTHATHLSRFALILKDQGNFLEAQTKMSEAIKINEKDSKISPIVLSRNYSNLAAILIDLGNYVEAKKLLEKALQLNLNALDHNHPYIGITYSNLASALQKLGDYRNALTIQEKVYTNYTKNFGPNHAFTLQHQSNIAVTLKRLGRHEEAKNIGEKIVEQFEATLGPFHPHTALAQSNLAAILIGLKDYPSSQKLLQKAILTSETNPGEELSTITSRYMMLTMVELHLGLKEEAIKTAEKVLGIFQKSLPSNDPQIAALQSAYDSLKQDQEA